MKKLFIIVALVIATYGFSGGLEEPAKAPPATVEAPKLIAPATSKDVVDNCKPVVEDNCKPVGNSVVTNGGDNVGTKVICACESKSCEPKVVEKIKYVKGPIRYVEKKVVVPGKIQPPKIVYMDRPIYIDRPSSGDNGKSPGNGTSSNSSSSSSSNSSGSDDSDFPLGVGVLVGSGPDGVRPYRYGQEYKAEVGRGILMGLDADYTIKKRYFLGGIIINNDTYMGKIGIRF
jgi:hypothetical protein